MRSGQKWAGAGIQHAQEYLDWGDLFPFKITFSNRIFVRSGKKNSLVSLAQVFKYFFRKILRPETNISSTILLL
jgi:hypothetical protein